MNHNVIFFNKSKEKQTKFWERKNIKYKKLNKKNSTTQFVDMPFNIFKIVYKFIKTDMAWPIFYEKEQIKLKI